MLMFLIFFRDLPLLGTQNAALVIYSNPDADSLDGYKVDHRPDIIKIPSRDRVCLQNISLGLSHVS